MSNFIALKGTFELEEPLQIDRSYDIGIRVNITEIQKSTNNDGTYNYKYKAETEYGAVSQDAGKTVRFTKKGSQSAKLRQLILSMGLDYESTMAYIIDNIDDIVLNNK